ncbi:MAG: hypothetical protein FD123_1203 [Bacteroidetes bacterium]|nr:MAG: hypothetical protein FD123_1203 [Bacteroidota bacterium]
MKSKKITLALFLAGLCVPVFSQKTISKSNALFGPMFKTIYTIQEVKIAPRITLQTSVKTRPASNFKFFGLGAVNVEGKDYQPFGETKLSAVGNVTEMRVFGKEKGAYHGFYFGPYLTYMHYKLQSAAVRAEFKDAAGTSYFGDISQVVKLNMSGVGFQIGTQGMYLKNHLAIDWTILGVGLGLLGFEGGIEAENTSENFDFRNYPDDIDDVKMGIEKVFKFKRTVDPTSMTIGAKIPWPLMRMGVLFGFGYGGMKVPGMGKGDKKDSGAPGGMPGSGSQKLPMPDDKVPGTDARPGNLPKEEPVKPK